MTRARSLALALAVVVLLGACSYSTQRLADLPASTRTVAVLTFENAGFRRDIELRLTQAVAREIRARTPYALDSAANADVLLAGRLVADESVVTLDAGDNAIQKRLGGSVEVTLTDRRTGAVIKTYAVSATTEFTPERLGQSVDGSATDELTRRLAERIVEGFERGF